RGRGPAVARYKNQKAYAAVVIEVLVDRDSGQITPVRAVIAADAGQVIDPSGLANQLEGGLIQSTSWTLKEQVRFDRVRVTSTDWESYPILRFPEVPTVETVLLDRPGGPYLGSGEAVPGEGRGGAAPSARRDRECRVRRRGCAAARHPVHAGPRARGASGYVEAYAVNGPLRRDRLRPVEVHHIGQTVSGE